MLSPSNIDTEIFAEFEAAEQDDATVQDRLASAFMHRIRAAWRLNEKAEILREQKVFHAYLKELAANLSAKGYPPSGKPYSIRWFQEWMFLAKHLPTEADAQPVARLGMKENLRRIRNKTKPKPTPLTGDVTDEPLRILIGDCMARLREIPDASIDCVLTSPPYYRTLIYPGTQTTFGGDACCDHDWDFRTVVPKNYGRRGYGHSPENLYFVRRDHLPAAEKTLRFGRCRRCGAESVPLGWENTPQEFVGHLVQVFAEVKRVLKPTGVLWVNIADSFSEKELLAVPERFVPQ